MVKAPRPSVARILRSYVLSTISEAAALTALDALFVRGAFRPDDTFVGYDYRDQHHIDTPPARF